MIATLAPTAHPTTPDTVALAKQFADLATKLTASDATLQAMVTERSTVGTGWGPHLSAIAGEFQVARDGFLALKPKDGDALAAKLGTNVLKLAEAAGSLNVMSRQRATLSEGWGSFLDSAIADATAAAALVAPPQAEPGTPAEPTKPADPATPALDPAVATDVDAAFALVMQSIEKIRTVPVTDRGDASTKDARIAAYNLNMQAQQKLEGHMSRGDAALTSALRGADAYLEDANWQLAKKPSPDGRFNGVDIPGALRDSQAAADALEKLVNPTGVQVDPTANPVVSAYEPSDPEYCRTPDFGARQPV